MRRFIRLVAAAAIATGLTLATGHGPASAEGECVFVGVDGTGALVCTPGE